MHQQLLFVLVLLFIVLLLVMLAQKIKIAYPIFLVLAGLAISFIPAIPKISINHELIFLIFLPPLIYEAAWYTSWNDFWRRKGTIAFLAFDLVFFTSMVVAFTAFGIIPGFSLPLGFLLGGIISPTDAVAAENILTGMKVPKTILIILKGETLVNDASSLIVCRFALAAVVTGSFSMPAAVGEFVLVTGMGVFIGLAGAHLMYAVHRFLPTTPNINTALTLMTPYILYLGAEQFHFSGIMAVVSGGLYLSFRSLELFSKGETRLNMVGTWNTITFMLNALVFIIIGLDLPEIINGLGNHSIFGAIKYGVLISMVTIIVRFIWVYPVLYVRKWLSKATREGPSLGWKGPLIMGMAGMRGGVSLATALSIPVFIGSNVPFPFRNLILFITFIVIFITLVLQGLVLPLVIKLLRIKETDDVILEDREHDDIRARLIKVALQRLNDKYALEVGDNERLGTLKNNLEKEIVNTNLQVRSWEFAKKEHEKTELFNTVLRDIYSVQRKELFTLRKEKKFNDELIRELLVQIDLDELKIESSNKLV